MNQNAIVLVYECSSLVDKIVKAVRAEAETGDRYKDLLDKVRKIVKE